MAKIPDFVLRNRKYTDKSIPGIAIGFNDPTTWMHTGCYALNYLISDDFYKGIPLEGKMTQFAGDSGSGKSYIAVGNVMNDAHAKGVYVFMVDTENSLDKSWVSALNVSTDDEHMTKVSVADIDDLAKWLDNMIEEWKVDNMPLDIKDRQKVLVIIDSVGMLITKNMQKQFAAGDQKGDMGIKAKQLSATIRVTMAKIATLQIGLVITNHVYNSQDEYKPDTIAGGYMLEFASSIVVQMNKLLLKVDENGKDLEKGVVAGINSSIVTRKSRYAKPFEKLKIQIPYDTGMNPYSGLFELFTAKNLLVKEGISYVYTSRETGEVHKELRKNLRPKGVYDLIMKEQDLWDKPGAGFDHTGATEEDD